MGVFRHRFVGPAAVPGDLPESGALRQQLVDQGVMGRRCSAIAPDGSAANASAGSPGVSIGSSRQGLCRATHFSTAMARFCQRWNRSATCTASGAAVRAASA